MAREIRVYGYHGTSVERAMEYLEHGFPSHSMPGDWLGDGIYFWQDAPFRATEWAREHYADPAVIGSEIVLRDCLDLLDIIWEEPLRAAYLAFARGRRRQGKRLPGQKGGYHNLDREVMNFASQQYRREGRIIRAARAAFREGRPIYPRSALFTRSHVQIALRDPDLIINLWRVTDASTER